MATEEHGRQSQYLESGLGQKVVDMQGGVVAIGNPLTDQQRVDSDPLQESRKREDMAQAAHFRAEAQEYANLRTTNEQQLRSIREKLTQQFPEDPMSYYPEIVVKLNLDDPEEGDKNQKLYQLMRRSLADTLETSNRLSEKYADTETTYIKLAEQLEARWR